ncbi:MAG: response regulator [Anaerolineae bacterium]
MAKILIAEDEDLVRYLLKIALQNDGHQTLTAINGREALLQVDVHQPDIVLLDLRMPGIDGAQVIRSIRANPIYTHMRIVVITGIAPPIMPISGGHVDLVLEKPVPIQDLMMHIQRLL